MAINVASTSPALPVARPAAQRVQDEDTRAQAAAQRAAVSNDRAVASQRETAATNFERQSAQVDQVQQAQPRQQTVNFADQPRSPAVATDQALRSLDDSQRNIASEQTRALTDPSEARRAVESYRTSPAAQSYLIDFSR